MTFLCFHVCSLRLTSVPACKCVTADLIFSGLDLTNAFFPLILYYRICCKYSFPSNVTLVNVETSGHLDRDRYFSQRHIISVE